MIQPVVFDGTKEGVPAMIEDWWNKTNKKQPNLFIHIPRTGGHSMASSMEEALMGHWSASVIRKHLGMSRFDKCKVFSVVRNTWDRMLSLYLFTPRGVSFEKFVASPENHLYSISQLYFLCDGDVSEDDSRFNVAGGNTSWNSEDKYGKIIVNNILRFETLNKEAANFGYVLENIQSTKHKHYSHYYTSEMRDAVQDKYRDEIERFGFVFEGTPTGTPTGTYG